MEKINKVSGMVDNNETIGVCTNYLYEELKQVDLKDIVILCIGTDRSTGDSLGPLVGEMIKASKSLPKECKIYGNLEYPIHAKNLCDTIEEINYDNPNAYIIAIDACLGSLQNVGKIIVEEKPLNPGAAMDKGLPKVGNIGIIGVVNILGAFDFMVLQNTRLYTSYSLATSISKIVLNAIEERSQLIIKEQEAI